MRKHTTIWILYAVIILTVFFCSSCASHKHVYKAKTEQVRVRDNKKQKAIVGMHLWGLIATAWIIHFTTD